MFDLVAALDGVNFGISWRRWQLFEFGDLWIVPAFIKHEQHDALAARWRQRIPFIQRQAPTAFAAEAVHETLTTLLDRDESQAKWRVIDFGSGSGGPVSTIEARVNRGRYVAGQAAIPFALTDLHPDLDAWMELAAQSKALSFIPQPVDAARPPFSVISSTTRGDKQAAFQAGLESDGDRVFRLFCLTFHHFDDETAMRVLKSTFETSDAFAIIELQERNVLGVLLVFLETCTYYLLAILWFWKRGPHLFFTYVVPLLPATLLLDGLVSCLRTRTFEETLQLVRRVKGQVTLHETGRRDTRFADCDDWRLTHQRLLHTWPLGYMTIIIGKKIAHDA